MGSSMAIDGHSDDTTDGFYIENDATDSNGSELPLYGISDVLTVPSAVPEPSTVMLVGLGGLAALGYSFKRKRA